MRRKSRGVGEEEGEGKEEKAGRRRKGGGKRREETEKRRYFQVFWSQDFLTLLKITEDVKRRLFMCVTSSDR